MLNQPVRDPGVLAFLKRTVAAQAHLIGCLAAIGGLFVLLKFSDVLPDKRHFWGCLVYGLTSIFVFAISAIYHFIHDGFRISPRLEKVMENLDHVAIYLFIAGTYTPFLLNAVVDPWQDILLIGIWTVATLGILYTSFKPLLPQWAQHRFVYTGLFVLMGWTILVRIGEIIDRLSSTSAFYLLSGAAAYSLGAIVYATRWPRLFSRVFGYHELWHVMVVIGFSFHFMMILSFYRL